MAVEVVGFEMVQGPVENGTGGKPVLNEKENGKLEKDVGAAADAIKFGSRKYGIIKIKIKIKIKT